MFRKIAISCAVLSLVLVGCDKPKDQNEEVHMAMPRATNAAPQMMGDYAPYIPPPDIVVQTDAPARSNALFSLQHNLALAMARDAVPARFAVARDACLKDKALQCVLTSASLTAADTVSANLQVALPHEKVAVFEKILMKRLPQDGDSPVEVTSRTTSVENQTTAAADEDRELTQAKAYRDQLEALSKRSNLSVDEVLKIHAALTQAQEAVNTAEAAKRATDSKIVLERMTISLEARAIPVQTSAFDGFWTNAHDVFMASLAEMLLRLVNVLPWLPLATVVAWLVARFMRRWRRVTTG